MSPDFKRAVDFVVRLEGGDRIVNDSGGVTKWGISKRAHPDLDIPNLTRADAEAIYWRDYWLMAGCELLPWPMSLVVFDTAVNQGVTYGTSLANDCLDYTEALMCRVGRYSELADRDRSMRQYFRGWIGRVVQVWKEAEKDIP